MYQDLQTIREMEAKAKRNADTAVHTFEEIRAERIRIEAAQGVQHKEGPQKGGGTIIKGPWVAGIGIAAGAAGRWLGHHSRPIAATSTSLLVAGTTTLAVIQQPQPWTGHSHAARPVEVSTYGDQPAIGHTNPPHIGLPKAGPAGPMQQGTRPDHPGQHKHLLAGRPLSGHPLRALVPPHPARPVRSALPAAAAPVKPRELLPAACRRIRLRQTRLCLPGAEQN